MGPLMLDALSNCGLREEKAGLGTLENKASLAGFVFLFPGLAGTSPGRENPLLNRPQERSLQ